MDASPLDFTVASTTGNTFVTDICLHFLVSDNGWLPTSTWVRLLGAVEVLDATARTALFRLAKTGYLERGRREGVPGYATSQAWRNHILEASSAEKHRPESEQWLVVAFSVPEAQRSKRHQLRVVLERLGFAVLSNGTWLGVGTSEAQLTSLLARADLSEYVDVFLADYRGFADPLNLAKRCWDIPGQVKRLAGFNRTVETLLQAPPSTSKQAFVELVQTSNAWRRLDQQCPQLPKHALPENWNRSIALDLRDRVIQSRRPLARKFVAMQEAAR